MDPECVRLCAAMNLVPGISTIESCCGHGETAFRIWFVASDLEDLPPILYWFDGCHCGHSGWTITASTDCAMSPVHFMVEGPTTDNGAVAQADRISELLENDNKQRIVELMDTSPGFPRLPPPPSP